MLCTLGYERVLGGLGDDRIANCILAGVLLVGTVATALIKADYRSGSQSVSQSDSFVRSEMRDHLCSQSSAL